MCQISEDAFLTGEKRQGHLVLNKHMSIKTNFHLHPQSCCFTTIIPSIMKQNKCMVSTIYLSIVVKIYMVIFTHIVLGLYEIDCFGV